MNTSAQPGRVRLPLKNVSDLSYLNEAFLVLRRLIQNHRTTYSFLKYLNKLPERDLHELMYSIEEVAKVGEALGRSPVFLDLCCPVGDQETP